MSNSLLLPFAPYALVSFLAFYLPSIFIKLPLSVNVLTNIYTYAFPNHVQSGTQAEDEGDASGTLKRRKGKEKDGGEAEVAQIYRVPFSPKAVLELPFFKKWDEVVLFVPLSLVNLVTCIVLSQLGCSFQNLMAPLALGTLGVVAVLRSLIDLQFDKKTSVNDSSVVFISGAIGLAAAAPLLVLVPTTWLDFGLDEGVKEAGALLHEFMVENYDAEPSDLNPIGVVPIKLVLAIVAAIITGLLTPCIVRVCRCFMLGTDRLTWDTGVIESSWWSPAALRVAFALPFFCSALWIKPMAELFIKRVDRPSFGPRPEPRPLTRWGFLLGRDALAGIAGEDDWSRTFGVAPDTFAAVQVAALVLAGVVHLACVRLLLQAHLNSGVIHWWEMVHARIGVTDDMAVRQKVLVNHVFLCKAAIQAVAPGALVLLFVLIACTRVDKPGSHSTTSSGETKEESQDALMGFSMLVAPTLVRSMFMFLAWWSCAVWAVVSATLVTLSRAGILRL